MPKGSLSSDFADEGSDSEGDAREGSSRQERLKLIADFWEAVRSTDETGATDRATLDEIEREVSEAMYRKPPDVNQAESLCFKAIHLISGTI